MEHTNHKVTERETADQHQMGLLQALRPADGPHGHDVTHNAEEGQDGSEASQPDVGLGIRVS